ncbi:MAG: MarR family transcriptional regulator [Acidobacteria bacterium]|nr:MarR family transcriptional regulator [Acidobacteriota bacterium]
MTRRKGDGDGDPVGSLLRLANTLTRDLAPVFERAHVTPQQWMLLTTLASIDEEPTLAGLARHMMVSKQNVTGMVRRLEDVGLVRKSNDPEDLRSSRVVLTRRGMETVQRLRPAYQKWVDRFFATIPEPERHALVDAIERLLGSNAAVTNVP